MKRLLASAMAILTGIGVTSEAAGKKNPPIAGLSGVETQAAIFVMLDKDMRVKDTVYTWNSNKRLTPASLTKLFTTAAILDSKGSRYRIRTRIGYEPETGIVVLHGAYDPTTDSRFFDKGQLEAVADTLAEKLKAKKATKGLRLTTDKSLETQTPYCPKHMWYDMGNYYGVSPSDLMADDNMTTLYFSSPKGIDRPCKIDSMNPDDGWKTRPISYVRSYEGKSDQCFIYMAGDTWYADGQIPSNRPVFEVRSSIPYPTEHYGKKMARLLRERGIDIEYASNPTLEEAAKHDRTLMNVESPEIWEVIRETNLWSINHYAEAMLMHLASIDRREKIKRGERDERKLTWEEGVDYLKNYWKERAGIDIKIADGSGLSPKGSFSAGDVVKLLEYMGRTKEREFWINSLPVAGMTGTMSDIGERSVVAGKVWAKTGSMSGVMAVGGYMECKSGRMAAFCLITNHDEEPMSIIRKAIGDWLVRMYKKN